MKTALVPLAQGCEELEAVTIMDVLTRGGVKVVRASLGDELQIQASRGTQLLAETSLQAVEEENFDLIALPGGLPGADYLNQDLRLRKMLQKQAQAGRLVAAICAAPMVLVSAGLLDGKRATSYPGVIDQHPAPGMQYLNQPVVQDGNIITSQGPATAMAFALTLVEALQGKAMREEVAQGLLFA
ncbi:DJ-1 family glyoxalase III [Galenea microaerophila]